MRVLIALAVFFGLIMVGIVGFVVRRETQHAGSQGLRENDAAIAVISSGEKVDIAAALPSRGYAVVVFESDT